MHKARKIKDIYSCQYIESDEELYPLQKWYNQLIDKRISEISTSDVLMMLRQNQFTDIAILKAVDFLTENPFAGYMYDGEILKKLSCISMDSLSVYIDEIKTILSKALMQNRTYDWFCEEERQEFNEIITNFSDKIMGQ